MTAAPRPPRLPVRLALGAARFAAALFLALVLLEVSVRVLGLGVPQRAPIDAQPLLVGVPQSTAPGLHNALAPGAEGRVVYPGFGGRSDRTVEYRINEHGLRHPPLEVEASEDTLRIACIGDSVTYGTGVQVEEALPAQLEARLAAAFPDRRIEVLNAGVFAQNTSQQVAHFAYRVRQFDPDVVLLCTTVPDASGKNIVYPPAWHARPRPWQQRWLVSLGLTSGVWARGEVQDPATARTMWLRRRSRLVDLVAHSLHGWLAGGMRRTDYLNDWAEGSPGREQVSFALQRLVAHSRRDGFDLYVAMYPTLATLDVERYPFRDPHAAMRGMCEPLDLPFLDLLPAFDGRAAKALHAHEHDRHPNAEAHGVAADALAEWLEPRLRTRHFPEPGILANQDY